MFRTNCHVPGMALLMRCNDYTQTDRQTHFSFSRLFRGLTGMCSAPRHNCRHLSVLLTLNTLSGNIGSLKCVPSLKLSPNPSLAISYTSPPSRNIDGLCCPTGHMSVCCPIRMDWSIFSWSGVGTTIQLSGVLYTQVHATMSLVYTHSALARKKQLFIQK